MKKTLLMAFGLFLLLPVSSAFAFGDGILSEKEFTTTSTQYTTNPHYLYDNNLGTSAIYTNGTQTIVFNSPKNINAIKYHANTNITLLRVRFYSSSGALLEVHNGVRNDTLQTLNLTGIKRITVSSQASTAYVQELEIYETPSIVTNPVGNLSATHNTNSINLKWINPTSIGFDGVIIQKDGVEIGTLGNNVTNYLVSDLEPETTYTFQVIAKYNDGGKSEAKEITVTTDAVPIAPPTPPEVISLKAVPTHERVDLSWTLPESDKFKHVNIYRDTVQKVALIDKVLGTEIVHAASTKIFETNGTYFNDLTVSPETTYEYTLTTVSTDAVESLGVTKKVTTLKAPKPEIGGGGYEKDEETGDYTYYWTSPTTGLVKILVGGVEYKTVSASDLKIVIPKEHMKFTLLGSPDVRLIPIDEDGNEGIPTKPPEGGGGNTGGIDLPFGSLEIIKGAFELLKLFGPYILIALSIILVPRLIKIIKSILQKNKERNKGATR